MRTGQQTWDVSRLISGLGSQAWGDMGPKREGGGGGLPCFESGLFRSAGPSQAKSSYLTTSNLPSPGRGISGGRSGPKSWVDKQCWALANLVSLHL